MSLWSCVDSLNYLLWYFAEQKTHRFGTTQGRVNDERIFRELSL